MKRTNIPARPRNKNLPYIQGAKDYDTIISSIYDSINSGQDTYVPDENAILLTEDISRVEQDVSTLTGTFNQINESSVIGGAIKEGLTTLFTAVTDAAGAYKTYALTSLEDEVLTEEELTQLEILKQAYIDAVGAFKAVADPISISLIQVSILKDDLMKYAREKAQIDSVYPGLYEHTYLTGGTKTAYAAAKSAYDTAYYDLVNTIDSYISGGTVTPAEYDQVQYYAGIYNTRIAEYKQAEENVKNIINLVAGYYEKLRTYAADKSRADNVYLLVYNNIYLVAEDKTSYASAKSAYDTAYSNVVSGIGMIISTGTFTPSEMSAVSDMIDEYLSKLSLLITAEETARKAIIDEQKRQTQEYAETQWQDVIDTQEALEQSLLNFSESINPITAQMMQLIVGDESLQYIFVESKVNPVRVSHSVSYDTVEKKLTVYAGWIKHLTLGITDISPDHTYKFWQLPLFTSASLTDPSKSYYLYAKCSDAVETGEFILSETPIAIDAVSGYYHLLVGILNAETNLTRRFAPLYGFTEVLPGRITLDKIVSVDGQMVIDLINNTITAPVLKISSGGVDKDIDIEELLNKEGQINAIESNLGGLTGAFNTLRDETLVAMEDGLISEAERRSLYAIYVRLDIEQEQLLSDVMYAINSIYMPPIYKDKLQSISDKFLSAGGSLDQYQESIDAILDHTDPHITDYEREEYNRTLLIYSRDHSKLVNALRDSRLAIDAEIKRLANQKTEEVEGGKNLIRNYDQRWDWDFWGGSGISVDIDIDAITIVNQRGLMDDGNLIEDESGNIIELV